MKKRILSYVSQWQKNCYSGGLPDEAPKEITHLVPDYKKIAVAILKNDYSLKTLGFSPPKSKVYDALKRKELEERNRVLGYEKYKLKPL